MRDGARVLLGFSLLGGASLSVSLGVGDGGAAEVDDCAVDSTRATVPAAEARPTPRPARSTTTKVIAATATTTDSHPSAITRSGRRPIPTPVTLFLP